MAVQLLFSVSAALDSGIAQPGPATYEAQGQAGRRFSISTHEALADRGIRVSGFGFREEAGQRRAGERGRCPFRIALFRKGT